MFNFLKCIYNFFKLIILNKNSKRFFFVENKNIYQYLEPYIESSQKKCILISKENLETQKKNILIVLNIDFFLELALIFLNAKYLYSSTPDLENSIFKKSKITNCKYIYLQHSNISLSMGYNEHAFNNFDAIQAINIFQINDIKKIKKHFKKKIRIIKSKYLFLDKLKQKEKKNTSKKIIDVLIAPTWNTNIYSEFIFNEIIKILTLNKISFTIRPHHMSLKENFNEINLLNKKFDIDKSPILDISKYDYLITDWSGIFLEFIQIKKKKVFLLNTKKKILNTNYSNLFENPIELELRDEFGVIIDINNLDMFGLYCSDIKQNKAVHSIKNFDISEKQLNRIFF